MSNVSNQHDIKEYISGESKALTGQYLAKAIFKGRNGKAAQYKSQCASVPVIDERDVQTHLLDLMPHIMSMLRNAQNECVRTAFLAGKKSISSQEVNINAAILQLDAEAKGTRLTAEDVVAWFDAEVQDALTVAFADKLGISDKPSEQEMKRIQQNVEGYKQMFASLSSGKTRYSKAQAEKLLKALQISESDSVLADKFSARLQQMIAEWQDIEIAL